MAGGAVPGICNDNANWRTDSVEAHQRQVQARPPHGREHLGPSEEPGQQARIWPRPARPAPQGQDVATSASSCAPSRSSRAITATSPRSSSSGATRRRAHEGRHRAEPDRPARAPPRHDRLSRQVRADDLRRAPARQPRPHPRQRREVQHRLAPRERRRRDRARRARRRKWRW